MLIPSPMDPTADCSVPAGIAEVMVSAGGRVTFAHFMELALAHPTDGYYSNAGPLLGAGGHFSTAPRLCSVFNRAVLRLVTELVDGSLTSAEARSAVVELGGGEGDLARAVLEGWSESRPDLMSRVAYLIVELGENLRCIQRDAMARLMDRGWSVSWGSTVADASRGPAPAVFLGNEFVDALPVHRVDVRASESLEAWVELESGCAHEVWDALSPEADAELKLIFGTADAERLRRLSRDGFIELRPAIGPLMEDVSRVMPSGSLLIVDYGEWLAGPDDVVARGQGEGGFYPGCCRAAGQHGHTVRGYFRHQLVADTYVRVGRQDLTADVDFRALDLHGRAAGFETILFTNLAALLRADGAEQMLAGLEERVERGVDDALDADRQATILRALLEEEGLGGAFKVMLQVRE